MDHAAEVRDCSLPPFDLRVLFLAFYYLVFWNLTESTFIFFSLWNACSSMIGKRQEARGRDKLQINKKNVNQR